jgi:hypothetical protein
MTMRLDVAKLDVALAHKEASEGCPFCTRRDWTTDEMPAAVSQADPDTGEPVAGVAIQAAVLVCKNCGFIRFHAVDVLFREGGSS